MPRIRWSVIATGLAIAGCPNIDECDPACPGGLRCYYATCIPVRDGGDAIGDDSASGDEGGTTGDADAESGTIPDAVGDAAPDGGEGG